MRLRDGLSIAFAINVTCEPSTRIMHHERVVLELW